MSPCSLGKVPFCSVSNSSFSLLLSLPGAFQVRLLVCGREVNLESRLFLSRQTPESCVGGRLLLRTLSWPGPAWASWVCHLIDRHVAAWATLPRLKLQPQREQNISSVTLSLAEVAWVFWKTCKFCESAKENKLFFFKVKRDLQLIFAEATSFWSC